MTPHPELRRIDLALAREPQHPEGDEAVRLTLVLPLQADGRVDPAAFDRLADQCRASLLEQGARRSGPVTRHGGGWRMELEGGGLPVFRLAEERLEPGEYVSVGSGTTGHVFRVVSVRPL